MTDRDTDRVWCLLYAQFEAIIDSDSCRIQSRRIKQWKTCKETGRPTGPTCLFVCMFSTA